MMSIILRIPQQNPIMLATFFIATAPRANTHSLQQIAMVCSLLFQLIKHTRSLFFTHYFYHHEKDLSQEKF